MDGKRVSANVALFFSLVCPLAVSSWTAMHQTPSLCLAAAVQHGFRTFCDFSSEAQQALYWPNKKKKPKNLNWDIFCIHGNDAQ